MAAILGFVLLAVSLFLILLPRYNKDFKPVSGFITKPLLILGLMLTVLTQVFFYAHPGHYYVVQYPSGNQKAIVSSGVKPRLFGQVIDMKQVLTLKFSEKEDGEYSGWAPPFKIRFNDAVEAAISTSIRIRLPSNPQSLLHLALEYRSLENLVNGSMMPTIREVLRNSARMISAQEYIMGKGGIFEQAVSDQMQNGIYELEIRSYRDTSRLGFQTADQRQVENNTVVRNEVLKILDKNGIPVRKSNDFIKYGIEVSQVVVDNVDPEQKFKDLLDQQRDAAGKANVARQEAQRAQYEKEKIIAQGESKKAETRVAKEVDQLNILVAAETEMKQAQTNIATNKFALEAAELAAKATKVTADAEAYQRERMMKADNALDKRLAATVKINEVWAGALKGATLVPTTMIQSGDSKGGSSVVDLIHLLTANAAKQASEAAGK
jgi:regulator of protease activity HflC (stomatin/prohibitin superfamily)